MSKKGVFDAGAVWLEALEEFEEWLHVHVEQPGADQLRFQTGRLLGCLKKRIEASGTDERVGMFSCYELATNRSRGFGYDEARRMHGEEMAAWGLASAGKFCSGMPKRFEVAPEGIFLEELRSRIRSVVSWMECQESLSVWLVFRDFRSVWRGSWEERARAVAAVYLSRLHKNPENVRRVVRGYGGKGWSDGQWANILRQAADVAGKRFECKELERWVWWCYPVFRRYRWNAREVLESASRRGLDFEKEKDRSEELMIFQKDWIRRGLRFSGGKQRKDREPPLREFVERVVLPDEKTMWGQVGGLLFLPKKKR